MNEIRRHERCINCHAVKRARLMLYIKRLWFCSASCYNAYFRAGKHKPGRDK